MEREGRRGEREKNQSAAFLSFGRAQIKNGRVLRRDWSTSGRVLDFLAQRGIARDAPASNQRKRSRERGRRRGKSDGNADEQRRRRPTLSIDASLSLLSLSSLLHATGLFPRARVLFGRSREVLNARRRREREKTDRERERAREEENLLSLFVVRSQPSSSAFPSRERERKHLSISPVSLSRFVSRGDHARRTT